MTRRGLQRFWLAAVIALPGLFSTSSRVSAQLVYLYTQPSPCTMYFRPISGVTYHAGGGFELGWYSSTPGYGPIQYTGSPNPAISLDGKKKWSDPSAMVTCWVDWYRLPAGEPTARYRWHFESYGGSVVICATPTQIIESPGGGEYDPYSEYGSDGDCTEPGSDPYGGGGGGGGGGTWAGAGGSTCHTEFIVIEVSNDGGQTWTVMWEGNATVCE